MQFTNISDSHVHSSNSFDARSTVLEQYNKACELGFLSLSITDHFEAPFFYNEREEYGDLRQRMQNSVADIHRIQEEQNGKTKLLCGIELGSALQNFDATSEVLSYAEYDFVLASLHNVADFDDFFFMDYKNIKPVKILELYFKELLDLINWGNFDSLAHLTYPLRYIPHRSTHPQLLRELDGLIGAVLKNLAESGKALEINTSGLRHKMNETMPGEDIVRRFKELGGELVTIGSDAHKTVDLGFGLCEGMQLAKKCGFSHYAVYEQRQPKMIEII